MRRVERGSRPTPAQSGRTHSSPPELSHAESAQIDLCRIIGIYFKIGVHVPPGTREINYLYGGPLDWLWFIYVDTLGRASVAVLSFFGGYLLFLLAERKSVAQVARDRAVTIYLPMVTWNFIGVALMIAGGVLALGMPLTDTLAQLELDTIEGALNKMLGLADKPALVPYTFLRDFFVSAVLARLALPLFRKAPLPVLAAVMLVAV
ncbi:MAG: acyltransferase family protein, partial [Geminicoccaceae bacterium]